jgi:hypothetical protein
MADSLFDQLEMPNEDIRVTHSEFTLQEFGRFARELRDIETVKTLMLRSNKINDDMVVQLADALQRNKSIREL